MNKINLSEICRIQYGFPFDSEQFSTSEGIPIVRIRDVVRGFSETYTTEKYKEDYVVHDGDILIGMDGEFNIAKWKGGDALLNQRVCRLFPTNINSGYLYYYLPGVLKQIEDETPYSTVKHLSAKRLNAIEVPIPSEEMQHLIASVMDHISNLLELRKEQLAKLDELVKSQFIGIFGDPVNNEKDWNIVRLEEVCDSIVRGPFGSALKVEYFVSKTHDTIKVYEQKNAIQSSASIGNSYLPQERYAELTRFTCGPGDIIMSCSGTIGRIFQLPAEAELGIINQALCKFHLNKRMIPIVFMTFMKFSVDQLETKGSAIKNIGAMSYIKNMKIPLAPINVQEQFAAFVRQTDKSKLAVQRSIEKLETLKEALMQVYFGGSDD